MANLNLSLIVKLVDQATGPVRRIGQTVAGLQRPFRAARMAAGGLLKDLRNIALVGAAAGAAAAVGLYRIVRSAADAGDTAFKTSQKIGVGVVSLQRLTYAAKLADLEIEGLADGLKFLNRNTVDAATGTGPAADAFRSLRINVRDVRRELKPAGDLVIELADRFQAMPDGPLKTAAAMKIFGRSGVEMIPFLNQGGAAIRALGDEAERLGLVMSEEQAKNAEIFNDSITTMQEAVRGLGMSITGDLLPDLTALIQRLTAMIAANKPAILARMRAIFTQIADALPGIIKGLSDFARFLGDIARVLGPVIAAIGGFNAVLDLLAILVVTRVALAIWSAVAAVWGLNGAMLANPVGLVIIAIAALVLVVVGLVRHWKPISAFFAGVWAAVVAKTWAALKFLAGLFFNFTPAGLIIKHWASIVDFFRGMWARIGEAFKAGIAAVWSILPPWFRQVLRGASFVIRTVSGVGSPPAGGGGDPGGGGRPPRPPIAVGAAGRSSFGGEIGVRALPDRDGRTPEVFARSSTPGFTLAPVGGVGTRGDR